jgi:hypothetical protein
MTPTRWSTPIGRYGSFAPYRLPAAGEARWHESASDSYAYIEFEITEVDYN